MSGNQKRSRKQRLYQIRQQQIKGRRQQRQAIRGYLLAVRRRWQLLKQGLYSWQGEVRQYGQGVKR